MSSSRVSSLRSILSASTWWKMTSDLSWITTWTLYSQSLTFTCMSSLQPTHSLSSLGTSACRLRQPMVCCKTSMPSIRTQDLARVIWRKSWLTSRSKSRRDQRPARNRDRWRFLYYSQLRPKVEMELVQSLNRICLIRVWHQAQTTRYRACQRTSIILFSSNLWSYYIWLVSTTVQIHLSIRIRSLLTSLRMWSLSTFSSRLRERGWLTVLIRVI